LLYLLYGEDDYSKKQALDKIRADCGDAEALASNTAVLDGQRLTLDQLRYACETVPFLAERRLVVIEGLLARYEAKEKPPRRKAKAAEVPAGQDPVITYFRQVPDFTTVVLLDSKVKESNPLLLEMAKVKAAIQHFPLLKGTQRLTAWIERRVKESGGRIAPRAALLMAEFVGSDLWAMSNEIDKLILFAGDRQIEEQDVREAVSYVQEASIFALTDAILEFRGGAAQGLMQRLMDAGTSPSAVLVFLARQLRLLVNVKSLSESGISKQAMQSRLGISKEFVFRKAFEQAGKYSMSRLIDTYHRLLDTDLSIKTGAFRGELALDVLIAELVQKRQAGGIKA